jgi:hypothetical protein
MLSWTRSGFSADDSVRIPAGEGKTLEHVARYMLRSPVSLSRMQWSPGSSRVLYTPKDSHDDSRELFPSPTVCARFASRLHRRWAPDTIRYGSRRSPSTLRARAPIRPRG